MVIVWFGSPVAEIERDLLRRESSIVGTLIGPDDQWVALAVWVDNTASHFIITGKRTGLYHGPDFICSQRSFDCRRSTNPQLRMVLPLSLRDGMQTDRYTEL